MLTVNHPKMDIQKEAVREYFGMFADKFGVQWMVSVKQ